MRNNYKIYNKYFLVNPVVNPMFQPRTGDQPSSQQSAANAVAGYGRLIIL